MGKLKTVGYELRDVAVMQAPVSFCNHRSDVNPFINVCDREVYPIFVSPMASVTDQNNYKTWIKNKLTPVVPRSVQKSENNPNGLTFEERMELAKETFVSVSLKEAQNELKEYLLNQSKYLAENPDCGLKPDIIYYICIDIAHGTLSELYDVCKNIKFVYGHQVEIMTGNVANPNAYSFYADAGIDWMRATIGSGSRCFIDGTKVVTKTGLKNIEDINISDEVLTPKGYKKVKNLYRFKNDKELLTINNEITCTNDHKFFVINKKDKDIVNENNILEIGQWVEAKDLNDSYLLVKMK